MDRNTIIGLVLIVGIVLTWTIFFSPDREEPQPNTNPTNTEQQDSARPELETPLTTTPIDNSSKPIDPATFRPAGMDDSTYASLSDSTKAALVQGAMEEQHGVFAPLSQGEDKVIHVSTDKLEFDLHTKGGIIRPLIMKEFKTYDSLPLPLITNDEANYFSMQFFHRNSRNDLLGTETKDLYLQPSISETEVVLTGDETKEIGFRGSLDGSHYFELVYKIRGNSYDYDLDIRMEGMTDRVQNANYDLKWSTVIPKTEKAMALQREKTAVYYRESGDVDDLGTRDSGPVEEELNSSSVDWVAFKSQFFSQTMMVKDVADPFRDLNLRQATPLPPNPDDPNSGDVVKVMGMSAQMPIKVANGYSKTLTFVNTPLEYGVLKDYDRSMTRQISLGWGPLKFINMYLVIPVFDFLEGAIGNYGIIILLLAILIKLLLYPLTFKTYTSTAKMRVINKTPEIKALEEKYKDEPTKLQQEKMGIYRKMGVNMFGGCLPMLLQYPFLISLFFLFPNLIELRQQGFLWADDLSTYDSILELGFEIPFYGDHVSLFTLLMTVSIFIYTIINQQMQGTTQSNPVLKYFPYVMPLIFLGFLNNYSSGLSWYYLVSNIISITQAQVSKLFINEEKLLAQMKEKSKQKKGNGKGQGRLAKWAEQQQKKQKQMQQARNNNNRRGGGGRRGR